MSAPNGINYTRLREAMTPPAKEEMPIGIVNASDLIKVGGLYRIREGYEAVWRMEADETGRRYIVRADSGDEETPERLRVAEDGDETHLPKAAGTVMERSAYKVIHAGAVYVAWECADCATPNLSKYGSANFECDECHKKYAVNDVLQSDREPTKNTYTRAEVEVHSPEFARRMGRLGINRAHVSLLQAWEREATNTRTGLAGDATCPKCGDYILPESRGKHEKFCPGKKTAKHNVCTKCWREYNGAECPTCNKKEGAKAVNPWAVCHESVGPEKSDKFERCVKDVKEKQPTKSGAKNCPQCGETMKPGTSHKQDYSQATGYGNCQTKKD